MVVPDPPPPPPPPSDPPGYGPMVNMYFLLAFIYSDFCMDMKSVSILIIMPAVMVTSQRLDQMTSSEKSIATPPLTESSMLRASRSSQVGY